MNTILARLLSSTDAAGSSARAVAHRGAGARGPDDRNPARARWIARRRVPLLLALAHLAMATTAFGQRTWVVDAANGPGTDFVDIPPALAAAADGDTIRVRPGGYAGGTTGKALTMLGGAGVRIRFTFLQPSFAVAALPAGRTFTMKGFTFEPAALATALLSLQRNAGDVHLDDVTAEFPPVFPYPIGATPPALDVDACVAVSVNACRLRGGPGLHARASTIALSDSTIGGENGGAMPFSGLPVASYPGARLENATAILVGCRVNGGSGWVTTFGSAPPSPGMVAGAVQLVLAGDPTATVIAGSWTGIPTSAVVANGDLLVDPTVTLTSSGGAPAIGGGAAVITLRLPALEATGAPPGGVVATELYAPAGHLALLFVGLPATPVGTGVGQLWIAPATLFLADVGVQDATEHRAVRLPIPSDPVLRGLPLACQALSGSPLALGLSTPAVAILD